LTWWLMWIDGSRWRYIRAEGPCWKGEIQAGRLVLGWQRATEAVAPPQEQPQEWQPTTALELLHHVLRGHQAVSRERYIECSCGSTFWHPPVSAPPVPKG
jgi:hypothetical protein